MIGVALSSPNPRNWVLSEMRRPSRHACAGNLLFVFQNDRSPQGPGAPPTACRPNVMHRSLPWPLQYLTCLSNLLLFSVRSPLEHHVVPFLSPSFLGRRVHQPLPTVLERQQQRCDSPSRDPVRWIGTIHPVCTGGVLRFIQDRRMAVWRFVAIFYLAIP